MQKLNEGEGFSVKTSMIGMKVGADIDAVLTGRVDWAKLVGKIAEAFQIEIQDRIYAAFIGAAASLPHPR